MTDTIEKEPVKAPPKKKKKPRKPIWECGMCGFISEDKDEVCKPILYGGSSGAS